MHTISETIQQIKPHRQITGMSAVLLPFTDAGDVDWSGFDLHVRRTLEAGLQPAVNMDTGYINLIDRGTLLEVLRRTASIASGSPFVAGAFVADAPGSAFNLPAYAAAIEQIQQVGTHSIFMCRVLAIQHSQQEHGLVYFNRAYHQVGELELA